MALHVLVIFPTGQTIDLFAIAPVEFDEGTDGVVADLELVEQQGNIVFPCADTGEAGGHANHFQKGPEGANAVSGRDFRMLEIHVASPDTYGELGEPVDVVIHDVFHPCREDDGQCCAMRGVVEGGEFVRERVTGPVLFASDTAGVVMGECACPHQVGPMAVVVGMFEYQRQFVFDGQQNGFAQAIGQFDVFCVGEVAFENVSHDVRCAPCGRQGWQGLRKFRIQDGKDRTDLVAGIGTLEHAVFAGDDGNGGRFAAGCRDGQDGADGQG